MPSPKKNKVRLDTLLVKKGLIQSRERAKSLIMAGKVLINDIVVDKSGTFVSSDAEIKLKTKDIPFVSRGGLKLEKALKTFPCNITKNVCLDIGASTGGFTDCLLQFGAAKVYAVDVGYGQLDWSLRNDSRVVVIERSNIRKLDYEIINEKVDLVVADTSFISLKIVVPAAEKFMKDDTLVFALIKPQFEAGKNKVGKGGVVKDPSLIKDIIEDIKLFFDNRGYRTFKVIPSPILGPKGNKEFIIPLIYQKK